MTTNLAQARPAVLAAGWSLAVLLVPVGGDGWLRALFFGRTVLGMLLLAAALLALMLATGPGRVRERLSWATALVWATLPFVLALFAGVEHNATAAVVPIGLAALVLTTVSLGDWAREHGVPGAARWYRRLPLLSVAPFLVGVLSLFGLVVGDWMFTAVVVLGMLLQWAAVLVAGWAVLQVQRGLPARPVRRTPETEPVG